MRDVFKKLADEGVRKATDTAQEVEVLARLIGEKMEFLHGRNYRVVVDQHNGYVFVVKH